MGSVQRVKRLVNEIAGKAKPKLAHTTSSGALQFRVSENFDYKIFAADMRELGIIERVEFIWPRQ